MQEQQKGLRALRPIMSSCPALTRPVGAVSNVLPALTGCPIIPMSCTATLSEAGKICRIKAMQAPACKRALPQAVGTGSSYMHKWDSFGSSRLEHWAPTL